MKTGEFLEPHGIVFDSNNTMFVTDMKNSRVQVFDENFNFKRQWGSFGNISGQFSATIPGIDYYEKEGLVFVVDKTSTNVKVFEQNRKFISKFGSKGSKKWTVQSTRRFGNRSSRENFCS